MLKIPDDLPAHPRTNAPINWSHAYQVEQSPFRDQPPPGELAVEDQVLFSTCEILREREIVRLQA